MRTEHDRHLGVRQNFYLSNYENKMLKSAMSEFGYANKSQFMRDMIFKAIYLGRLVKEADHAKHAER